MFKLTFALGSVLVSAQLLAVPEANIERYTVTTERSFYDDTLARIFPQYRYNQRNIGSPVHINDILLQSPSVSLNGQGGQLQNINIRGFSRWRVHSLVDGVPVVSDRRAGASIGFVPPSLIDNVSVVPGATSTYLGSGAIGGAVNLHFNSVVEPTIQIGVSDNQNRREISYADVVDDTDWHIAYRHAGNGEDANSRELLDGFEQTSFFIRHRSQDSDVEEAWTLYSHNRDIGKSSSDFPTDKITVYPSNTHWLGKLRFNIKSQDDDSENGLEASVWWHRNTLETNTLRPEKRINTSDNEALDFGASVGKRLMVSEWFTHWQLQVNGREGVITDESEFSLPSASLEYAIRTLDASELNVAGVLDASRSFNSVSVAAGGRVDWQRQSTDIADVVDAKAVTNANVSGFIGTSYALSSRWTTSIYLSSAFRNPSLTERFFSGETPRGTVLGDSQLDSENAINTQATVFYADDQISGSLALFYQEVDNYIERKTVRDNAGNDTEILQYSNLDSAVIKGANYQIKWNDSNEQWGVQLTGAFTHGKDNHGATVADIPPHNHRLTLHYDANQWRWFSSVIYRASKREVGDGERELERVVTLDIGAALQLTPRITVNANVQNLTNQLFYSSADDKAAFAQGRTIQLSTTFLL